MDSTLILFGLVILLALANAGLSFLPRKSRSGNVVVSFVPPSTVPIAAVEAQTHPKLDAHILSSNQKISLLFSRVEKVEKDVENLFQHLGLNPASEFVDDKNTNNDSTWVQTPPVRVVRKKGKKV
ncbi:MAG: hypothetical protein FJY86_03745 [Candidatus Diapherotrites archaeon]|uniref:Uncharacterized protein n=1 Tax=Candidatus Iainarchaeum sp. TaxID=3101447 RepID=A0A8T4C7F2_9ARCH|nr:hypothetical protein [Candidatus Diapherotrites archaeon]